MSSSFNNSQMCTLYKPAEPKITPEKNWQVKQILKVAVVITVLAKLVVVAVVMVTTTD